MCELLCGKNMNSVHSSGPYQSPWVERFRKTAWGQEVELEEDAEKEAAPSRCCSHPPIWPCPQGSAGRGRMLKIRVFCFVLFFLKCVLSVSPPQSEGSYLDVGRKMTSLA